MTGWTIDRTFDCFDDFLDHLDNNAPAWLPENRSTETPAKEWNGNVTFMQAMNLARYGWPEGRTLLSTVSADLKPENIEVSASITREIDVAGAYPIVALAVAGDPCHMVDVQETDAPSRIVKCVVSISQSGSIDAPSLTANGAAVCSYIDALELAGWSCEIWGIMYSLADGNMIKCSVCIKRAGDMLDIDRVAFALAHPAMLRRLVFRVMEIEAKAEASHARRYGTPSPKRPADCQVYVDRLTAQVDGPQALARVADSFQAASDTAD